MNKKTGVVVVLLVLLVIVLAFFTIKLNGDNQTLREEITQEVESRPEITLNIKRQYKDNEHIFVGTLALPSPCHSYNAEIIAGEIPEIKLTTSEPEINTVCIQVVTYKDFKVSYSSENSDQEFKATLNGDEIGLNIFEVSPEDDIDSVELFLKG